MRYRILSAVVDDDTGEITGWDDTGKTFAEAPAPAQTLGGRLIELKYLSGVEHMAEPLADEA
jgi:hypothetical protein